MVFNENFISFSLVYLYLRGSRLKILSGFFLFICFFESRRHTFEFMTDGRTNPKDTPCNKKKKAKSCFVFFSYPRDLFKIIKIFN